ncbi:MAG: hypothetical protein VW835_05810 [Rickettsiales bacterium]
MEMRLADFDAFGQHEAALKLPCRDATVQKAAFHVVFLPASDNQLAVFDLDREIGLGKTRNRQGNPQRILADLFDIVGRIAFCLHLRDAIQGPLEFFETQQ